MRELTTLLLLTLTLAFATACGDASPPGNAHLWPAPVAYADEVTTEPDRAPAPTSFAPQPRPDGAWHRAGAPRGYGWSHAISADNFDPAADGKLGGASSSLAGHTLREIVTDPNVRVRGDDRACATCHAWAQEIDRATFCARVPRIVEQPTSKGDGEDPANAKPAVVKDLLQRWYDEGCPE